jgi:hypothetical protein
MKSCDYCGRENEDQAVYCCECGGQEFKNPSEESQEEPREADQPAKSESTASDTSTEPKPTEPSQSRWTFRKLTPAEKKLDFVTLLTCENAAEAHMVVGQLESAGICAFIPDEYLAFGYLRVLISPKDYELAKDFLTELAQNPEPSKLVQGPPPPPSPEFPVYEPTLADRLMRGAPPDFFESDDEIPRARQFALDALLSVRSQLPPGVRAVLEGFTTYPPHWRAVNRARAKLLRSIESEPTPAADAARAAFSAFPADYETDTPYQIIWYFFLHYRDAGLPEDAFVAAFYRQWPQLVPREG